MTWSDALTELAIRIGEPEAATLTAVVSGELDTPFFYKSLLESRLLIAGQMILRRVGHTALERVKSPALAVASGGSVVGDFSELALASTHVRVLSVTIDDSFGVEGSVAALYQRALSTRSQSYTFADSKIRFKGTSASVVYVKELALADWQGAVILPEEYDESWLMLAYTLLMVNASLPAFRT